MPLNRDAAGARSSPQTRSWTTRDSVVYALGVGCGTDELAYATDDTPGAPHRALPTMAVVLGVPGPEIARAMGDVDRTRLVHGSQQTVVHAPLPAAGSITFAATITGVYDKGSGAAVETETVAHDADGRALFTNRSVAFIRGEGGWGGDRGPSVPRNTLPERAPDHRVGYHVPVTQALLYRLSGDRNRLHSDPEFARAAGFDRPILHGLCTYGYVGRALLGTVCGGDVDAFGELSARFVAPVFPGDRLEVAVWETAGGAVFQGERDGGQVVITGSFGATGG